MKNRIKFCLMDLKNYIPMHRFLFLVCLIFVFSCQKKENEQTNEPITMSGEAYGSTYQIVYYSYGKDLNAEIEEIMNEFDKSVNTYIDDSYLSKFNKSEHGAKADKMLLEMFSISKQFNTTTQGYFDPTVSGLSDLWGFSKKGFKNSPKQQQIDSTLATVGLQNVFAHTDSLSKNDKRITLNFNSMTGYVNDKIAEFLDSKKVENYLIEIGGEILAKGKKPDGTNWKVGIDKPVENLEDREIMAVVSLENQSMATSGNYRKFFVDEKTGQKIVHTMNPKTGKPEASNLLSASVIAKTCAEADAVATATMAMGLEKAKAFAKDRNDLKFYLIWNDENGDLKTENFHVFPIEEREKNQ